MVKLELKTGKVASYYDEEYGEYSEHETMEVEATEQEAKLYAIIYNANTIVETDFNEDTDQEEYDKYIPLYELYQEIDAHNYKEVLEKASNMLTIG